MSKHQFTAVERYAVFTVHGEKCHLCPKPVNLRTMEVDHLIPESLADDEGFPQTAVEVHDV